MGGRCLREITSDGSNTFRWSESKGASRIVRSSLTGFGVQPPLDQADVPRARR